MNGQATFVFDGTDVDTVFVDRLSFVGTEAKGEVTAVEHASPRTLVVLHSRWMSYRTGKPASGAMGEMFGDDMCGGPWMIDQPQKLLLRCLNIESSQTKFINKAGTVWVLSFKDEGGGTAFVTGPGAATEVLGGELYGSNGNTRSEEHTSELQSR